MFEIDFTAIVLSSYNRSPITKKGITIVTKLTKQAKMFITYLEDNTTGTDAIPYIEAALRLVKYCNESNSSDVSCMNIVADMNSTTICLSVELGAGDMDYDNGGAVLHVSVGIADDGAILAGNIAVDME